MFFSILFERPEQAENSGQTAPECFHDLNLDRIFAPIMKNKKDYSLSSFFYTPLRDESLISYRQDVMRELEDAELCGLLTSFSHTVYHIGLRMNAVRECLRSGDSRSDNYLTRGRMLGYAELYCSSVTALKGELERRSFSSSGLRNFCCYLREYCSSGRFTELKRAAEHLRTEYDRLQYCMLLKNGTIRVRPYEEQENLSLQVSSLFEKFRQGDSTDYRQKLSEKPKANHVEAAVLSLLAKTFPEQFRELASFGNTYLNFDDKTLLTFTREIQFYLSWTEYIRPVRDAGLSFCFPGMKKHTDDIYCRDGYDLALAQILLKETVVNDFSLQAPERIAVVTGPNQGGKTTYARAFGQIHYLGSLGLCVPGRDASLLLFDHIATHFGREEELTTLNGKLQDDLVRLHSLLEEATQQSLIIVNEIFSSTTLSDALLLGNRMMDAFTRLGAPCIVVTFLDELAQHGPETVSLMSTVFPEDPAKRTYRIVRKPPDGLAYAMSIAGRHGLTYDQLDRRLNK